MQIVEQTQPVCIMTTNGGWHLRKARHYFDCVGILPATYLNLFPILIKQLFCFLCCFSSPTFGQLVTDSVLMKGYKSRNLHSLYLTSPRIREENRWGTSSLSLLGNDKKPLGLGKKKKKSSTLKLCLLKQKQT